MSEEYEDMDLDAVLDDLLVGENLPKGPSDRASSPVPMSSPLPQSPLAPPPKAEKSVSQKKSEEESKAAKIEKNIDKLHEEIVALKKKPSNTAGAMDLGPVELSDDEEEGNKDEEDEEKEESEDDDNTEESEEQEDDNSDEGEEEAEMSDEDDDEEEESEEASDAPPPPPRQKTKRAAAKKAKHKSKAALRYLDIAAEVDGEDGVPIYADLSGSNDDDDDSIVVEDTIGAPEGANLSMYRAADQMLAEKKEREEAQRKRKRDASTGSWFEDHPLSLVMDPKAWQAMLSRRAEATKILNIKPYAADSFVDLGVSAVLSQLLVSIVKGLRPEDGFAAYKLTAESGKRASTLNCSATHDALALLGCVSSSPLIPLAIGATSRMINRYATKNTPENSTVVACQPTLFGSDFGATKVGSILTQQQRLVTELAKVFKKKPPFRLLEEPPQYFAIIGSHFAVNVNGCTRGKHERPMVHSLMADINVSEACNVPLQIDFAKKKESVAEPKKAPKSPVQAKKRSKKDDPEPAGRQLNGVANEPAESLIWSAKKEGTPQVAPLVYRASENGAIETNNAACFKYSIADELRLAKSGIVLTPDATMALLLELRSDMHREGVYWKERAPMRNNSLGFASLLSEACDPELVKLPAFNPRRGKFERQVALVSQNELSSTEDAIDIAVMHTIFGFLRPNEEFDQSETACLLSNRQVIGSQLNGAQESGSLGALVSDPLRLERNELLLSTRLSTPPMVLKLLRLAFGAYKRLLRLDEDSARPAFEFCEARRRYKAASTGLLAVALSYPNLDEMAEKAARQDQGSLQGASVEEVHQAVHKCVFTAFDSLFKPVYN